jgi:hypothetical protein
MALQSWPQGGGYFVCYVQRERWAGQLALLEAAEEIATQHISRHKRPPRDACVSQYSSAHNLSRGLTIDGLKVFRLAERGSSKPARPLVRALVLTAFASALIFPSCLPAQGLLAAPEQIVASVR